MERVGELNRETLWNASASISAQKSIEFTFA